MLTQCKLYEKMTNIQRHSEEANGRRGNPFSCGAKHRAAYSGKITDCHTSVRTGSQ